jgi:hypothetical protein
VTEYQKNIYVNFIAKLSPLNVFIGGPVRVAWIPDRSFRE